MSDGTHKFSAYRPQCRCVAVPFAVPGPHGDEIIAHEWRSLPIVKSAVGVPQDSDHSMVHAHTYEAALALCFWFMANSPWAGVECRIIPYDCEINWSAKERLDAAIEIGSAIDAMRSEVWHRKEREAERQAERAQSAQGKTGKP